MSKRIWDHHIATYPPSVAVNYLKIELTSSHLLVARVVPSHVVRTTPGLLFGHPQQKTLDGNTLRGHRQDGIFAVRGINSVER